MHRAKRYVVVGFILYTLKHCFTVYKHLFMITVKVQQYNHDCVMVTMMCHTKTFINHSAAL